MNPAQSAVQPDAAGTAPGPQVVVMAHHPGRHAAVWALTVVLAVLATAIIMRWDESVALRSALAQNTAGAGGRGIYAFTGQLTSKSYGLFMMDVDSGTIWCYELQRSPNGEPQLKLVAARSWIYDRYLEEFNAAEPVPGAVQAMVQQQRLPRDAGPKVPAGQAVPTEQPK